MTKSGLPGILGAMFLAVTVGACGEGNPFGPDPQDVEFAAELEVDLASMVQSPSGLFYQDLEMGTGDPAMAGDSVTLVFRQWLADGNLIDGGDFAFVIGSLDIIDGVNEGVTGMRVDGIRKLVVPSSLAYRDAGTADGIIPKNAVLVFEIELTGLFVP